MSLNSKNFKFIDLFAGIGGIRLAFESVGGTCSFSSEWDKYAQITYEANFGERPAGDITKISPSTIPDHDILLAGFPCQPFSIIGDKKGFQDTRGTLFYNIEKILEKKLPRAFLLENVKGLKSHDNGRTLKTILSRLQGLGYTVYWDVLNALDYGLPQKRERTFIVGFRDKVKFAFPEKSEKVPSLRKILEPEENIDPGLFASRAIVISRKEKVKGTPPVPSIWHENKSGNVSALPYSCALRAGASYNYLLVNGVRRLSARELLRLQGFPESFKITVSHSQIRKQVGNSVPVTVVKAIAKEMIESLEAFDLLEKHAELSSAVSDDACGYQLCPVSRKETPIVSP